LNEAVTLRAAVMETVQLVAVPLHAPPQLANVEPLAAVAVSVTDVPLLKLALQVEPQLMPDGEEAIVPLPLPLLVTASAYEVLVPPTPRMIALRPPESTIDPLLRSNSAKTSLAPDCAPLSQ
jgi:hypothetical protein